MTRGAVLLALVVVACSSEPSSAPVTSEPPPAAPRVDASDLLARYECARCHEIPGVAIAEDKSCVLCHQQIHAGTFAAHGKPVEAAVLDGWRTRIISLRWAPSLAHADRLRRDWVRDYLLAPHDVRPGLVAQMPRLALTPGDADRIAAHLVPDEGEPTLVMGDRARGEYLFAGKACGTCHRFTGASITEVHQPDIGAALALAPDLRHTRDRMSRANVASWITSPRGAMPALGIDEADARALATFIMTTPLAEPAAPPRPQRLPILAREVTWRDVDEHVFRDTCWHCHSEPD